MDYSYGGLLLSSVFKKRENFFRKIVGSEHTFEIRIFFYVI